MHFGNFATSLKEGIIEFEQSDPLFSNYSTTTMRLCGLRSFNSPLLGIGPRAGLPMPTPPTLAQGHQGWIPPGATGAGWPPPSGGMVPQPPGGWGQVGPMGLGAFKGFCGGMWVIRKALTFRFE